MWDDLLRLGGGPGENVGQGEGISRKKYHEGLLSLQEFMG